MEWPLVYRYCSISCPTYNTTSLPFVVTKAPTPGTILILDLTHSNSGSCFSNCSALNSSVCSRATP
jgi:hypothetical protein